MNLGARTIGAKIAEKLAYSGNRMLLKTTVDTLDYDNAFRQAISPHTSPEELNSLASHQGFGIRIEIAKNPRTPSPALIRLSRDVSVPVIFALLGNPNLPAAGLVNILQSKKENFSTLISFAERIAGHPNITDEISNSFIGKTETGIRKRLAENVNCSEHILAALARDRSLAANPHTSSLTLHHLLEKRGNLRIQLAVAQNPNTDLRSLQVLAQIPNQAIAIEVGCNLQANQKTVQAIINWLDDDKTELEKEWKTRLGVEPQQVWDLLDVGFDLREIKALVDKSEK